MTSEFAGEGSGLSASSRSGVTAAPMAAVLPTDPFFLQQYHLLNTASDGRDLSLFRGDVAVWDEFTGDGVVVGVIDDGIDTLHTDLDGNYDASLEVPGVSGFHPSVNGAHGTAVAGIIAAERNGEGTVGIAYDATLVSMPAIPAFGGAVRPISIADSYANYGNVDILNNSWEYGQFYDSAYGDPALDAEHALLSEMAVDGRDGLGTVFVKSAGNFRGEASNTVGSYTSSFWGAITVAAIQRDGVVSSYSTEGAGVLVSAFGGPNPGDVVTTDRSGTLGYNRTAVDNDVTTSFAGTSAAAPMVSGVAALMLEANPLLGARDVAEILALTAQHVGAAFGAARLGAERYDWEWNHADNWNGGGMHFSEDYGYGVVDALAAVRLAESWTDQQTAADMATASANAAQASVTISDDQTRTMTFTVAGDDVRIDRVAIDLNLRHTHSADLEITLTSPDGTVSELMRDNFGSIDLPNNGARNLTLASTAFLGEMANGTWTLTIHDDATGNTGSASNATLTAFGTGGDAAPADTYVYTEEFSDYASAARTVLGDTDGGVDTVNTAAVFGAVVIDLRADGSSTIDGVAVVTVGATIENVVTGDGNDTVTGNALANALEGVRGDDVLFGDAGSDTLGGGAGDDTLDGGVGADAMVGGIGDDQYIVDDLADIVTEAAGEGTDTVRSTVSYTLGAGVENLVLLPATGAVDGTGNGLDNAISGRAADNALAGGAGDDTLAGYRGADVLRGGDGVDSLLGGGDDDALFGGADGDRLDGERGADTLAGDDGADFLAGGGHDDVLDGGAGADTLDGGRGDDTLTGGEGDDTFVFAGNVRRDTVLDFGTGDDRLDFTDFVDLNEGVGVDLDDVIVRQHGADAILRLDLDGDGIGDRFDLDGDGRPDRVVVIFANVVATSFEMADFVV